MSAVAKTPPVVDSGSLYAVNASAKEQAAQVEKAKPAKAPTPPQEVDSQNSAVEAEKETNVSQEREKKMNDLASALADKEVLMRNVQLRFEVEEDTSEVIISVIDRKSGEKIRQIPPEQMVEMSKVFEELKGVLVNSVT